ncbi:CBS domain-containing protein [Streptomyces sp. NPDC041003]|uniref:CBS domain-containing protein n=1 Tax=Streptomyces sp. NPDC041003 TaxID=3155730 RepID=UPI0033D64656
MEGTHPGQPHLPDLHVRLRTELARIDEQLRSLLASMDRLQGLLDAVVSISQEVELPDVLRRIVTTAMDLVGARYGALGVLAESGEHLEQFITAGLSEQERADLAETGRPRGLGVLGHLIHHPEPLRVDSISAHPSSTGFPSGHPHLHTLLGVALSVRGEIYGDLYLSERRDGHPFDVHDENVVVALASAAGIAIEKVRLFERVRLGAEQFQRLLLPTLPDLRPFTAAAIYRPAAEPSQLGGDWYDAIPLADGVVAVVALMSTPAVTVHAEETAADAARLMTRRGIERLPVVDEEDQLVGIVTRRDLLRLFVRPDSEIRRRVTDEVLTEVLGVPTGDIDVHVLDGFVTLNGRVERRSQLAALLSLVERLDGVVAVASHVGARTDDTLATYVGHARDAQPW